MPKIGGIWGHVLNYGGACPNHMGSCPGICGGLS